jgi:hypothetical protein
VRTYQEGEHADGGEDEMQDHDNASKHRCAGPERGDRHCGINVSGGRQWGGFCSRGDGRGGLGITGGDQQPRERTLDLQTDECGRWGGRGAGRGDAGAVAVPVLLVAEGIPCTAAVSAARAAG